MSGSAYDAANHAWAAYERLAGSDVPKFTKRRNRGAIHDLLERLGEVPSRYSQPYFQRGWHRLRYGDGRVSGETHYFNRDGFVCGGIPSETVRSCGMSPDIAMRCKKCQEYARHGPGKSRATGGSPRAQPD